MHAETGCQWRLPWLDSLLQRQELDHFEFGRAGFCLNGDVTTGQGRAVVKLGLGILADHGVASDVPDQFVAANFHLHSDPLVAIEGRASGFNDVLLGEGTVPKKLGAGRADAQCAPLSLAKAAQQLNFDAVGEILIFCDGLRILAMDHQAVVSGGPARASRDLLSNEAIGGTQAVMGVRRFVEQVAELPVEFLPLGVIDDEQTVFDPESVTQIQTQFPAAELRRPAVEVLSIEERNPALIAGGIVGDGKLAAESGDQREQEPVGDGAI